MTPPSERSIARPAGPPLTGDLLRLPLLWDDADAWQRWFAAAGEVVPASVADDGLRLAVFTAEVGSRAAEALQLLASWSATPETIAPPDPETERQAPADVRRPRLS